MAETGRTNLHTRPPVITRHPTWDRGPGRTGKTRLLAVTALAAVTLVTGVASFLLGMFVRDESHASATLVWAATVIGVVSLAVGFYAQMISITRMQRILIVTGMIGAFVGAALGVAHGAFS